MDRRMQRAPAPASPRPRLGGAPGGAALGALLGLTWAAALRAYMVELAGAASSFSWWTLAAVLLPGAIAGACIGAAHARPSPRSWLLGLGPVAFALLPQLEPGALGRLLGDGLGGGAIGVALALVLGGFGLGTIGPRAARLAALAVALLLTAGIGASVPLFGGAALAPTTPRGTWAMLLAVGLLLAGIAGTALAFRPGAGARER